MSKITFIKLWEYETAKGAILTFILSLGILFIFFAPILKNPNEYYFASSGDGMQTYFHALYHAQHDTSLLRQQSINYPYGESVFFTGCMPSITNSIKLLKPIVDISDYTAGILNFLMLISIPLSAVFLYLLFRQFQITILYGAFAATGIAFLSPQLDRLCGHLALSFQFIVPAFIYFLSLFYQSPSYKKSILIGIFVFFISSQHLYYFGFAGIIAFVFYSILPFEKNFSVQKKTLIFHFTIQVIIPYLLLQLLLYLSHSPSDRTDFPWGFLEYRANTSSVFYPSQQWYESWIRAFITPIHFEWEGKAYVGLMGIIATAAIIILLIKNLITLKKIQVTGNTFLDILLLVSFLTLFYSFGFPFIYAEELLKYTGPVKQMRSVGRFTWIFFYVINIAGFYFFFQWTKKLNSLFRITLHVLAIALLFSEAYPTLKIIQPILSNKIPEMEDKPNTSSETQWLHQLNSSDFQAILPLPYFHIGSENITIGSHSDLSTYTYIISLKTGLPLYAVSASRTSLSETYRNVALVTDHTSLPDFPPLQSGKAFLVLCKRELLNEEELLLYSKSTLLFRTERYEILKFSPEVMTTIYQEKKDRIQQEISNQSPPSIDSKAYKLITFDDSKNCDGFLNSGALQFKAGEPSVIYNSILPGADTITNFYVSFWLGDFKKDLYPRTNIEISLMDSTGHEYDKQTTNAFWFYKQFHQNWALIEIPIKTASNRDRIKITMYNKYLFPKKPIVVDNLMIKTFDSHVYESDSLYLSKDNRYYFK